MLGEQYFVWLGGFFFHCIVYVGFVFYYEAEGRIEPVATSQLGVHSYALINGYYDTDTEVSQTELRIGYGKPLHRFVCMYLYRDMIFLPKHFCVRAETSWQFLRKRFKNLRQSLSLLKCFFW